MDRLTSLIFKNGLDISLSGPRVPVLARTAAKRRVGYQAIGYKVLGARDLFSGQVVTSNALATR
jgi:hypothetical protein